MNSQTWISRSVSRLLPAAKKSEVAASVPKPAATKSVALTQASPAKAGLPAPPANPKSAPAVARQPVRSTELRLKATLRQEGEALSPRVLRRILQELHAIVDPRFSELEGGRRATEMAAWYAGSLPAARRDMWLLMSEQFVADAEKVKQAQTRFNAAIGTPEEPVAQVHFRRATVSPRRRLLQRFSAYPGGVGFLVEMRAEMLPFLKSDKRLLALDVEMEYMFSTWFDVGFLELRRISWDSPASLIEKLIKYEAVHDIKSWADVKNRLDSDRRCYGFFHARLPDVPLIFVEVALADGIVGDIMPLLDEHAAASDLNKATTAIFYSISNTQPGLRGVSFGDSLIKRVVETLKQDFPKLRVFATLSPIPGFRRWLGTNAGIMLESMADKERGLLGRAIGADPLTPAGFLAAADSALELPEKSPLRQMLLHCAAHYLGKGMKDEKPLDPVARFHLGNGARIERLNWAADPSAKGLKQSFGLMVNYLYDLHRLDRHRAMLAQGKVPVSGGIKDLYI